MAGLVAAASLLAVGCAELWHTNTTATVGDSPETRTELYFVGVLKSSYFYPVRDLFEPLLVKGETGERGAWNVESGGSVPDGSFYTNRKIASLSPDEMAAGPCTQSPPKPPFTVKAFRRRGLRPTFFGTDAFGRKYFFKVDHADWPELATGTEIIGTRILWTMGYHVPANYLVTLEGTGRGDLDGRRAVASSLVPGRVAGRWKLDWFRYRREMRALRVACAWLNDVDRVDGNNLVAVAHDVATYYLLDFDSALGAWQGKPKPPWRGWRHVWDVQWQFRTVVSLGRDNPGYDPNQPIVSRGVGRFDSRFDPIEWRPQLPNSAFRHMTEDDAAWMARKIAALTGPQLEAIVNEAQFSHPQDSQYVLETLLARREVILQAWLPGEDTTVELASDGQGAAGRPQPACSQSAGP
ncbi:MAG TPA: hypothetical protein VMZ31_11415 [Phycisphaerae bacterium]|nr:hypothetical protein [Phycisphaerae bacterium]